MPTAVAPAASQAGTSSGVIPPVGTRRAAGRTARRERMNAGPPTWAGKTFAAPELRTAAAISPGVQPPSRKAAPRRTATSRTSGAGYGDTRKAAPASRAASASAAVVTVPTPITAGRPRTSDRRAVRATAAAQPGVEVVSSTARQPAASRVTVRRTASSASPLRSTGSRRWAAITSYGSTDTGGPLPTFPQETGDSATRAPPPVVQTLPTRGPVRTGKPLSDKKFSG